MEWTPDTARGDWIRERLDIEVWPKVPALVPGGFEAYARIFHPLERDIVRGKSWASIEADARQGVFEEHRVEIQYVRWDETARAFGTTMHPLAQSHKILGRERDENELLVDAEGWRYREPQEGSLAAESLAAVAEVLARHTETPNDGIAAIWEGFGGLVSAAGYAVMTFTPDNGNGPLSGLRTLLRAEAQRRSARRALRHQPEPGTGLLSRDAATGPRFSLPNRDYILFTAGASEFADESWSRRAPWVRENERAHPQSPSLLWPDDQTWFLLSEIDFDSTIVAGTNALVRELCAQAGIEAYPLSRESDLSWNSDQVD